MQLKRCLNKWQFGISFGKIFYINNPLACGLRFWACKFISWPEEGAMIGKENYKGLFKVYEINPTLVCTVKTFKLFGKYFRVIYKINKFHLNFYAQN